LTSGKIEPLLPHHSEIPTDGVCATASRESSSSPAGRLPSGMRNTLLQVLLLQADVPSHKDVVIAIIGATAALAGLVLVFVGVLVTAFQTLLGHAPEATLNRFKRASWLGVIVFCEALSGVAASAAWLIAGGGRCLYFAVLVLFFVQLVALLAVALYSTLRVLLQG
jgi:hypothetical protein